MGAFDSSTGRLFVCISQLFFSREQGLKNPHDTSNYDPQSTALTYDL